MWLRDRRSNEWVTVPWVYRSLAGQPFGLALWEHARRMTMDRFGPRPAEADIARNVAALLDRAHGQDLTKEEARVIAVDANRPARPQADSPAAPDDAPETAEELSKQPEPVAGETQDAYEVFDPEAMPWRL